MCQLLCLTSHDPAKRDEIIERAWAQMSFTQKDGYGAAWFAADGSIGYHKRRYPRLVEEEGKTVPFVKEKTKPVDAFGASNDVPSDGGFLIIHGRLNSPKAPIALANTHPFMDVLEDGRRAALIHNGLVTSWTYANKLPGCTCDSELLLQAYSEGGIDGVENYVDGRYAFMYLEYTPPTEEELAADPLAAGTKRLHVAKDGVASLYAGTKTDKTFVIATTETLITIMDGESAGELKNHVLLVFSDKETYDMTEYKNIPYLDKVGYKSWVTRWRDPKVTSAVKSTTHYHGDRMGPTEDDDQTKLLDAEISAQEQKEIERLEQQALDYAG